MSDEGSIAQDQSLRPFPDTKGRKPVQYK